MRAGRNLAACFKHGEIISTGHTIIHIRTIGQLAIFIVFGAFKQSLSDTLYNATMNLPFHDHWINDIAYIIYCNKAF